MTPASSALSCRRLIAGILAVVIGLGPLATPSYAALTLLADEPLNVQNKAQPNVMLTIDDSTSMLFDFLPDNVIEGFCRDMTGKMGANCGFGGQNTDLSTLGRGKYITPGYIFQQYGASFGPLGAPNLSTNALYDVSGPGAGCRFAPVGSATCAGGTSPGPLPGLDVYPDPAGPPPAKSAKAGQPYEYWTLWPAPVHNAEFNHIYYNPRLTYDPPVRADGSSYPQMTSANTAGWTQVPADKWWTGTPGPLVDLMAPVTVGLWCNSDWSVGNESNPAYCRTNGTGPTAPTSSRSSVDGDYNYPWAPPGIDPTGPVPVGAVTIAKSIAYSKVTATGTLKPAWATAQDPKYFYENDNTLWCDKTSSFWPQQGPTTPQTCIGSIAPVPQVCINRVDQTCNPGTPQTCVGATPDSCTGVQTQTCGPQLPQTCGGATSQTCVPPTSQTCDNIGVQTCDNVSAQTCNNVFTQSCVNITGQTCNNVRPQLCNLTSPTCNAPPPSSCVINGWDADGVPDTGGLCPCTGNECPICTPHIDCPASTCSSDGSICTTAATCPVNGTCSADIATVCTAANAAVKCPTLPGTCSRDGIPGCFVDGDCANLGNCSVQTLTTCRLNDICPTIPGQCSGTGLTCNVGGVNPTECPNAGRCSLVPAAVCYTAGPNPAECPTQPGQCTIDRASCFATSPDCDRTGRCSATLAACTSDPQCLPVGGTCSIDSLACTPVPGCGTAGNCSIQTTVACHITGNDPAECPNLPGTCTIAGGACTGLPTDCPPRGGSCSTSGAACSVDANCPTLNQNCSVTGEACTSATYAPYCTFPAFGQCTEPSHCPILNGTCSIDGNPCPYGPTELGTRYFFGPLWGYLYDLSICPNTTGTPGACSITGAACTYPDDPICGPQPGASGSATCSDSLTGAAVSNASFEAPFVASYQYGGGANWTFAGGAGIQRYGSPFGAADSGDGSQTVFLQNISSISQTMTFGAAGLYRVSFAAARRSGQVQPVQVSIDGVPVGSVVVPTADSQFSTFTVNFTLLSGGSHTVTIEGTSPGPDNTTFIDTVAVNLAKTLREDADTTGLVCRHNNRSGGYGSGPYTYPDARFNTPVTGGTGVSACTASPRYALIPRHYWKTGVEWCNAAIAGSVAATPKWQGYGDRSATTLCQDDRDEANNFIYPRFYQFGQPPATDNIAIPAFQRMDLDPLVNPTFDHGLDVFGDPIVRNFGGATPDVSEMTNYANWFAYYRTRLTAVKTVTSLAFKEIDSKYRVGFHTLVDTNLPASVGPPPVAARNIPPVFLNVDQFDDASLALQKTTWYSKLFGISIPLGQETPSLQALGRIGEYYRTGTHSRLTGAVDPIILSCSKNFHLFFTDGYTNEAGVPTDVPAPGDQDNNVPIYPYFGTSPIPGLVPGTPWPAPFREDTGSALTSNALSDYAMYYWVTDLQHSGPAGHNVLATDTDPATWQHQNFAAVSLGTTGILPAGQQSLTEQQLALGTLQWPVPSPSVFRPNRSGVDDLWHAAINGRGQFVNAQSVAEVKLGIGQVLADIAAQSGARAGAGLQSTSVGASSNFVYRARFEPGWAGSLTKVQINPSTGAPVAEVWKAATQLAAQLQVVNPGDTPWFTNRKIVTLNQSGVAVPFLWANMGAEQRDSFFPPNTISKIAREKAVIEYLRGNAANEGNKLGQFRKRKAFLGDIADSSPVYVGVKPNQAYRDGDDPGYSTFRSSTIRPAAVYVGANDGMLHVFDDATGNERWAYVPSVLYRGGTESYRVVEDSLAPDQKAGIAALAYQQGALPPFKHHYLVDGPLKVTDVDFGGQNWHTILVGGLGKGGNRYFALDVTNPSAVTNEATAASKVLWEFGAPQMGFTYGKPIITKTKAFGGTWLVILASGYNNPNGHGYLYFVRASDGVLLKTMTTAALDSGSAGTPSGLAHPAGYTEDFRNQLTEQIYAGDLLGDFWRFDINDANPLNWTVGKMARLLDPSDNPQPVTTPPQIEVDISNGVDRWVFVGTGKLYDDTDLTDRQVQTMYALRDGDQTAPLAFPGPFPLSWHSAGMDLIPNTVASNFGLTTKPAKGWYDNLPGGAAGQRIVVAPQAALGVVAYVGTSAQDDPCLTGQTANIYARQFDTGASVLQNSLGVTILSVASADGAVGLEIVGFDTAPGASQADIRLAITLGTSGEVQFITLHPPALTPGHRMSWRLLGQ